MCEHDLSDRETACADGMCPLCLAAENAALREENERLTAANKARAEYLTNRRAGNDLDSYVNLAETKIEELRAQLAEAQEELAQWRATGESVTRNEHDLSARLAALEAERALLVARAENAERALEEADERHSRYIKAVGELAGMAARPAEAEALLRDIYSYAEDQGMETLMDMIDSADSADAAQIVTISEHLDESVNHGWVIEGAWSHVQTPDYWVGSSAWSQDHNRALRFARKQDAEQAAAMMLDGIRVRFCEHAWTARE